MNLKKFVKTGLIFAASLVPTANLHAEEWEVTIAPYLWAAAETGKVATLPGAPPAEIDLEFDDILDGLEIAFMGAIDANKGRAGVYADIIYLSIDTDEVDTPGPFYSGADYEAEVVVVTLLGTYRYDIGDTAVDLLGGVRLWDADNQLNLKPGIAAATDVDEVDDWLDWMVGAASLTPLNDDWSFTAGGVVAIAGDSNHQFDVYAYFQYALTESSELVFGYRYLEVDYDNDDFLYDVEIQGPIFGAVFKL